MQLTENQQQVFSELKQAKVPLGAYALLERLKHPGFTAATQVYRALNGLEKQGLVHRLNSVNAYVCCANPSEHDQGVVAFAICDSCGHVDEFQVKELSHCLAESVKAHAFVIDQPRIEMHGRCANCCRNDAID